MYWENISHSTRSWALKEQGINQVHLFRHSHSYQWSNIDKTCSRNFSLIRYACTDCLLYLGYLHTCEKWDRRRKLSVDRHEGPRQKISQLFHLFDVWSFKTLQTMLFNIVYMWRWEIGIFPLEKVCFNSLSNLYWRNLQKKTKLSVKLIIFYSAVASGAVDCAMDESYQVWNVIRFQWALWYFRPDTSTMRRIIIAYTIPVICHVNAWVDNQLNGHKITVHYSIGWASPSRITIWKLAWSEALPLCIGRILEVTMSTGRSSLIT